MIRLGFLKSGFQDKYYYWEIILLLRKTFLVLLMTFMAPISGGIQSLFAIILLSIFYGVQNYVNPYYDPRLNNLEKLSLFALILTIYSGLYF